jgi:hypothetical protein
LRYGKARWQRSSSHAHAGETQEIAARSLIARHETPPATFYISVAHISVVISNS